MDSRTTLLQALDLRSAYKRLFGHRPERLWRFWNTRLADAYRRIFTRENDDVQRVLADLCKKADVTRSCFTPGKPDLTAYDNGARDLVLGILRMIHSTDAEIRKQIEEVYQQQENQ